jgi:hypothetical protein
LDVVVGRGGWTWWLDMVVCESPRREYARLIERKRKER